MSRVITGLDYPTKHNSMTPVVGGLITAGASLLGQGFNAVSQSNMNKKTRQWNEHMYDQQKRDNLDFWNMQNTYNSPEQQMLRLSKAGMNPQLAYGNGTVANTASSAPDAPHAMPYKPEAPTANLGSVVDGYFNAQTRAQQISNEKQIGNNLILEGNAKQLANTRSALENKFLTDTFLSRIRGAYGDNERKYQSAIGTAINTQLLQELSGSDTSIGNGYLRTVNIDGTPNQLKSDWHESLRAKKLGNELKGTAIQGNRINNSINQVKSDFSKRMFSGSISDMGSKDWLNYLMQIVK